MVACIAASVVAAVVGDYGDDNGNDDYCAGLCRAKPNTMMQHHPEPSLEELLWTVAAARILFGPLMNIQAPPNLTPETPAATAAAAGSAAAAAGSSQGSSGCSPLEESWRLLLDAGISDWGTFLQGRLLLENSWQAGL
jgi:hypothetical protein